MEALENTVSNGWKKNQFVNGFCIDQEGQGKTREV